MISDVDRRTQSPEAQLQNLIQLLFQELQAFGIFSAFNNKLDRKRTEEYIQTRVAVINFIVQSAELYSGLILNDVARPVLYNRSQWPENAVIAGYSTAGSTIKYSDLIHTYIGNWIYESEHNQPIDSRLLLAALWMWEKNDFKGAINYLLDLQKYGFVTRGLQYTVEQLIRLQALGKSIQEIVASYFDNDPPLTNTEWINKSPKRSFETFPELDAEPNPKAVQSVLSSITMDTLKDIKYARTLTDPIAWLLQQAAVMLRCDLVLKLFHRFSPKPTLTMKSILSQFEEIRADAIFQNAAFTPLYNPLESLLQALIIMFRHNFGEESEARLYSERLLYPEVRRDYVSQAVKLLESSEISAGKGDWDIIPPRIVYPFMAALAEVPQLVISRRDRLSPEQSEEELLAGFETCSKTNDVEEKKHILEQLCFLYPWSSPIYLELSIFYDQSGNPQLAWEPILTALVLNPDNPLNWQSFGVILQRLGNREDAKFALAMHEYLRERENK